jgi:hypothetical protein
MGAVLKHKRMPLVARPVPHLRVVTTPLVRAAVTLPVVATVRLSARPPSRLNPSWLAVPAAGIFALGFLLIGVLGGVGFWFTFDMAEPQEPAVAIATAPSVVTPPPSVASAPAILPPPVAPDLPAGIVLPASSLVPPPEPPAVHTDVQISVRDSVDEAAFPIAENLPTLLVHAISLDRQGDGVGALALYRDILRQMRNNDEDPAPIPASTIDMIRARAVYLRMYTNP